MRPGAARGGPDGGFHVPTLLYIDASPRGDYSLSRQLSAAFAAKWKEVHADGKVIRRDLPTSNLTFVDLEWIAGAFSPPDQHSEASKQALAISDTLIAELLEADTIVIGTPMYNFTVPAVLKAWIDHIVRAGKTFAVTGSGLEGLVKGKKVVVTAAAGANYDSGFMETMNFVTPYLKAILGFIGITDVTVEFAGGGNDVTYGKVSKEEFLAPHVAKLEALAAL